MAGVEFHNFFTDRLYNITYIMTVIMIRFATLFIESNDNGSHEKGHKYDL